MSDMKEDYQAFLVSARNVDECTLREAFEAGYLAGQSSAEQRVKELEGERAMTEPEALNRIAVLERERDEWKDSAINGGNAEYLRKENARLRGDVQAKAVEIGLLMEEVSALKAWSGKPVAWMHPTVPLCVSPHEYTYKDAIPRYTHPAAERPDHRAKFQLGDKVFKPKGSQWHGTVVGTYSTSLTPEGYAVENKYEKGSVQIYPAQALEKDV